MSILLLNKSIIFFGKSSACKTVCGKAERAMYTYKRGQNLFSVATGAKWNSQLLPVAILAAEIGNRRKKLYLPGIYVWNS